jgi:hypothetical protein
MIDDPEAVDRSLAIARSALTAPPGAKARVRANLTARAAAETDPGTASRTSKASTPGSASIPTLGSKSAVTSGTVGSKLTTVALIGVSFVAGYWLGVFRSTDPVGTGTSSAVAANPTNTTEAAKAAAMRPADTAHLAPDTQPPVTASEVAAVRSLSSSALPYRARTSDASTDGRSRVAREASNAPKRARPDPAIGSRASAPAVDPMSEELALLRRADRAIRAGEAPLALSFINELDHRYPITTLLEERTAARVLAECALSELGARRRAELFLSEHRGSVYGDRVRRSCEVELSTGAPRAADGSPRRGH